jgi:Ca2+-binding RTX toxin-like protein
MGKRTMILMAVVLGALVLSAGVALAGTIRCNAGATCRGTVGPDNLIGTSRADTILGLGGNDDIAGRANYPPKCLELDFRHWAAQQTALL